MNTQKRNIANKVSEMVQKKLKTDTRVIEVFKNNDIACYGITVGDKRISRVVYIDELIDDNCGIDEIVDYVINMHNNEDKRTSPVSQDLNILDYEEMSKNLTLRLVNQKINHSFLMDKPYKDFLDLALIAILVFPDKRASLTVNYDLLKEWEKSFFEVFNHAKSNLFKEKTVVGGLQETIYRLIGMKYSNEEEDMYVLTNEYFIDGAAHIIKENILKDFAKEHDSDILVIPSSIHEMILLPFDESADIDMKFISDIIIKINQSEVLPTEILSDHGYIYKKDSGWGDIC